MTITNVPAAKVMQFFRDLAKRQKDEGKARVEMYQEVGRAIVTLSEVEEILAEIYVFLNAPTPEKKSAKKFYDLEGIPRKIALVDNAVERNPIVKDKSRWKNLSARVSKHRLVRNIAAHSSIEFHVEHDSDNWKIAIGTQARNPRKREELFISDVKASADDLHDILHNMRAFLKKLGLAADEAAQA